jgi:two-component system, NarL family, response regulator DevR
MPAMAPVTVRVYLLDDHEVVRRGVAELLESTGEFTIVGQGGSVAEGITHLIDESLDVDVAVLDVRLGDGSGVELCREIRSHRSDVAVLMLTSYSDEEALADAVVAGASGFVLKQVRGNELVSAVRAAAAGHRLIAHDQVEKALTLLKARALDQERMGRLSDQERKIFDLIGEGRSNRQIADELYLAEKTVKNYVSNLLAKLGMHRRTEVAALAARLDERRRAEDNSSAFGPTH